MILIVTLMIISAVMLAVEPERVYEQVRCLQ